MVSIAQRLIRSGCRQIGSDAREKSLGIGWCQAGSSGGRWEGEGGGGREGGGRGREGGREGGGRGGGGEGWEGGGGGEGLGQEGLGQGWPKSKFCT